MEGEHAAHFLSRPRRARAQSPHPSSDWAIVPGFPTAPCAQAKVAAAEEAAAWEGRANEAMAAAVAAEEPVLRAAAEALDTAVAPRVGRRGATGAPCFFLLNLRRRLFPLVLSAPR